MKPLRLAFLADPDSIHTRRWLGYFARRGHEVHLLSLYPPARPCPEAKVHVLQRRRPAGGRGGGSGGGEAGGLLAGLARQAYRGLPTPAVLLATWLRYRWQGLERLVGALAPHVLHAHYVTAYGFYGTAAHYRPYALSAWGSDILRDAVSPLGRAVARYTLGRADLVTADSDHVLGKLRELGVAPERAVKVVIGVDDAFLLASRRSVNRGGEGEPLVLSLRSLERRQYNVDVILRAMALVRRALPRARLAVAGEGRLRPRLEALAAQLGLGDAVCFLGQVPHDQLPHLLAQAAVVVSVPTSDATPASLLEAMAVGCFPLVSDLPAMAEWVEDGQNGFRVRPGDDAALAERIVAALASPELRQQAAHRNLAIVRERALFDSNMAVAEEWYQRLAGG